VFACLSTDLISSGAVVPEWVHLVPAGTFSGADGRGPWSVPNPAAVIAASMTAQRLPVDENHATDLASPKGEPSPARGWIVEMQTRPDGIWGRVDWTETGRRIMAEKAYRFISPVFMHDAKGVVSRILRVALTNTPNLPQLKALNMSTAFDHEIDGSKDVKPTAVERYVARKMNIDPNKLARARQERDAQLRASDAERIREFERRTTAANNPLARQAAEPGDATAQPTPEERDIARRMGLDPHKLAQVREQKAARDRADVLENWDGYINPGGPADQAYELTARDRDACAKLGVDPQEFLAWKRDPISAVRPKGLPYDPYSASRTA
jgi:phage I-like protein